MKPSILALAASATALIVPQNPLTPHHVSGLLEQAAQIAGESLDNLDAKTVDIWRDMELLYPDALSKFTATKGMPQFKINRKPDIFWDFHVRNDKVSEYKLRVKKTDAAALGIDTVKQYSGYLDDEKEDKHWFYYFFESRNDPKTDPVILWLNGGPGCSSFTGLFFELGPSSIDVNLKPVRNPYSWNSNASVIFLDQPVNVGYSYSSQTVDSTVAASKDVYAFLELFFQQFPEFLNLPFHIAGESYGGHYLPAFAAEIIDHPERSFNMTSVLIGNGYTDPLLQTPEYYSMACTDKGGYHAVLSEEACKNMSDTLPKCLPLIQKCYDTESVFDCVPAVVYCDGTQTGPYYRTGRNAYDVRKMCLGSGMCYVEMEYIDQYLNLDYVKEKLGAEVDRFESCSSSVGAAFGSTGDDMRPFHTHVAKLLENGVPVLLYAGDKDFICNWLGNQKWSNALEWSGHEGFAAAEMEPWYAEGEQVGEIKNYGIFSFARIYDAGHMVPFDKPVGSLAMVNRWISGDYALTGKEPKNR